MCIPVNPSDPNTIPNFVDKLPIPYVMNLSNFKVMPAERIDLIIDFSRYKDEEIILINDDVAAPSI